MDIFENLKCEICGRKAAHRTVDTMVEGAPIFADGIWWATYHAEGGVRVRCDSHSHEQNTRRSEEYARWRADHPEVGA